MQHLDLESKFINYSSAMSVHTLANSWLEQLTLCSPSITHWDVSAQAIPYLLSKQEANRHGLACCVKK